MENLTDFTDTSDVSDAAIEWVLRETNGKHWSANEIRQEAEEGNNIARSRFLAARLIQQHRPDLLVDPVDEIVREELAKAYEEEGDDDSASFVRDRGYDSTCDFIAAKRLYLMGIEKGKQS